MKATMFENFVVPNHNKIVNHYRRLMNSSTSDLERERYKRCIKDHEQSLQRLIDEWLGLSAGRVMSKAIWLALFFLPP